MICHHTFSVSFLKVESERIWWRAMIKGWVVKSEEVSRTGWAQVDEGFVGEEKNLEDNAVLNMKPVEFSEDRCYMVMLLGFSDHSCCCILHSLQLGCKNRWYSSEGEHCYYLTSMSRTHAPQIWLGYHLKTSAPFQCCRDLTSLLCTYSWPGSLGGHPFFTINQSTNLVLPFVQVPAECLLLKLFCVHVQNLLELGLHKHILGQSDLCYLEKQVLKVQNFK